MAPVKIIESVRNCCGLAERTLKGKKSGNQLSIFLETCSLRWGWMLSPISSYNTYKYADERVLETSQAPPTVSK
jgi:hypothetical protein